MPLITRSYRAKLVAIQPAAAHALARLNRTVVRDEFHEPPPKWCNKCQSWLPPTEDFFYRTQQGNLGSPCKACIQEQKQQASAVKPCAVPGCDEPRHRSKNGRYTSYCTAHQYHMRRKGRVARTVNP